MGEQENSELKQIDCDKKKKNQEHECDKETRTLKLRRHDLCITSGKKCYLTIDFVQL